MVYQINATDLNTAFINRANFQDINMSRTMVETYASNLTGFSSGGFVWAAELTANILAPQANLVGSYYQGTLAFG